MRSCRKDSSRPAFGLGQPYGRRSATLIFAGNSRKFRVDSTLQPQVGEHRPHATMGLRIPGRRSDHAKIGDGHYREGSHMLKARAAIAALAIVGLTGGLAHALNVSAKKMKLNTFDPDKQQVQAQSKDPAVTLPT